MILWLKKLLIYGAITFFWCCAFFVFLFMQKTAGIFYQQKTLRIFTFPLMFDAQRLVEFEQKTGTKLYIHYYEHNDELLAKIMNSDVHGYDIIFPSDYAVELLAKKGLLKKINKEKLSFFDQINKKLCGHYFDFENNFSIPYLWEVYGIGFNKNCFCSKNVEPSWELLFNKKNKSKNIGMLNNSKEVVALAGFYLFGKTKSFTVKQRKKIKNLLRSQKKNVEVYTDLRADSLLISKTCSFVVCPANDVWMHDDPGIDFVIPKEGSFITIDNVCIPVTTKKDDLIYQFINYLYDSQVLQHNVYKGAFFPALKKIIIKKRGKKFMDRALEMFSSFHFFKTDFTEKQLQSLWIELKAY